MKVWTLGAFALMLAGCGQMEAGQSSHAGRYTIIQAGNRTMLIDTQEGRAWELIVDPQGIARGWSSINSLPASPT
jgi:hypothetical protein